MEDLRLRGKTRMSVPQFGGWDGKTRDETNYSVVFSQARANRKKHKNEVVTCQSLGNEREFLAAKHHSDESKKKEVEKKKTVTCFSCFFRPN